MAAVRAVVYCAQGTWVAVCPRPWCIRNPEWYGPGPVTGRVGGLTADTFHCLACGLVCPADWPTNRVDIDRVLAQRPFSLTRNWEPGETLADLIAENVAHGLVDPTGLPGGVLAVGDVLTDLGRDLVTTGPQRLQIGGQ